ncbi:MAG: cysteine--tRNA ligase [Acidimicrobiaceae bacterium]|nr:cysteine--tRNA ligase [Acidimicrobiaceae bacterium]MXY10277.1 cysteine--tRNA ligase [Acidimicrobiaceae bacterium]MXZ64084.1 cysteine--tRNA ligase [Acidimicrobiaceae bacterium]MYF31854.1 cysteine--tRNA ligase [Acidimicrobiaceae bacterium]MYG77075.1 cysteine--tRNA ligase [Acidimicrobiaceae bacterium]
MTGIELYDTLTGEIRPLEPREPGKVALYACGPTVYDHPHLGHARSALTYDVLRRYLEWRGLDVRHVANITDIDDNIINRARDEGRTESDVAVEWEAVYVDAMARLDVLDPHDRPRATEWVTEMVDFVGRIMDAGAAYTTGTGVYLRVGSVHGYGDLVHRGLDDLRASAGARVEVDEDKEDPLDFALWKAAKPDEPSWPSPWGPGRPGWHIECVAMSLGILGDDFDIHGGGNDLVFPHHTNERAEALAVGRPFARHWVHNAMLNIEGTKMSKSLGNYRTVVEMLDEHPLNGRAFRLLVLQTHYRKAMEVNPELMASARSAVQRLDALARRSSTSAAAGDDLDETAVKAFNSAMDDDLGTPQGVAVMFDTLHRANAALDRGAEEAPSLTATAISLAGALGLSVDEGDGGTDADSAVEELVARRQAAREAKDWAAADALRDELAALGVVVEDTPAGPIWRRQ